MALRPVAFIAEATRPLQDVDSRPRLTGPASGRHPCRLFAVQGFAPMIRLNSALMLAALPLLAGCNSNSAPVASAPAAYNSQRFPAVDMPVGTGCAAVIGRFEAVIKADY